MTIEYDSEKKRATHVETGLAVEFIEYGYMQDQNAYFNLIMGERKKIEAVYDFGFEKIRAAHPGFDALAISKKQDELNEQNFTASTFGPVIDARLKESSGRLAQVFVETWHRVVAERHPKKRCSVYFKPFFNPADGEWSFEG